MKWTRWNASMTFRPVIIFNDVKPCQGSVLDPPFPNFNLNMLHCKFDTTNIRN